MHETSSFINELGLLPGGKRDPGPPIDTLAVAREAFVEAGKRQIDLLMAEHPELDRHGRHAGGWFTVQTSGRVHVTLKNRARVLELRQGYTYFELPDREAACVFIAKAIRSAANGELDAHLRRTSPRTTAEVEATAKAYLERIAAPAAQEARHD